jgi:hypothetical protein
VKTIAIIILLVLAIIPVVILIIRQHSRKRQIQPLRFDNLEDVQKLSGGTARFTFQSIEYSGIIQEVEYIPVAAGAVRVTLLSLQPTSSGPAVPDIPLKFIFSLFMAEAISTERELKIRSLVPPEDFGPEICLTIKE